MIEYIPRSHAYYAAQGYAPYVWAKHDDVPFALPDKPLRNSRLALVTTAAPYNPAAGDQGPGAKYNAAAKFFEVFTAPLSPPPDLNISHIGYDRTHCEAKDPNTWLPIAALERLNATEQIGALVPELVGVPTNRSQRVTTTQDAPAALDALRSLGAEAALLVPT